MFCYCSLIPVIRSFASLPRKLKMLLFKKFKLFSFITTLFNGFNVIQFKSNYCSEGMNRDGSSILCKKFTFTQENFKEFEENDNLFISNAKIVEFHECDVGRFSETLLRTFPEAKTLTIRKCQCDFSELGKISTTCDSKISKLSFIDCKISKNTNSVIVLRDLQYLEFSNTIFQNPEINSDFLKNSDHLKTLTIKNCQMEKIDPQAFENLSVLESLDLSGNNLKTLSPVLFRNNPNLLKLVLHGNKFEMFSKTNFK